MQAEQPLTLCMQVISYSLLSFPHLDTTPSSGQLSSSVALANAQCRPRDAKRCCCVIVEMVIYLVVVVAVVVVDPCALTAMDRRQL